MIIGNGLIANAFEKYKYNNDVIIFSSGVSNSSEVRESEFNREEYLLREYLSLKKKLIYFSTISVVDESLESPYTNHKIKMEKIISTNHSNYLIFRLPIVVGKNANGITFFNSIKDKIKNEEELKIFNVGRYLIDIDDLSKNLPILIDDEREKNKTINICFDNFTSVKNIVERMEFYLKKVSNKVYIDCNSNKPVDNFYFNNKFKNNYLDYNERILQKYLIK
jgi:UDP-2-acetamido-2,6-beta-L-arabino-hexul-4-ose reductase